MPKIIENVREQLLSEAKTQIAEKGYAETTIRSVANACGLGVGTVYNYFKSKDMLIATFMAQDWQECLAKVKSCKSSEPEVILNSIFCALQEYMCRYSVLFADNDAVKVFSTVFTERHRQLRSQMAELIAPVCHVSSVPDKAFLAEYMAESLLVWTVAGKPFEEQYSILRQLLK